MKKKSLWILAVLAVILVLCLGIGRKFSGVAETEPEEELQEPVAETIAWERPDGYDFVELVTGNAASGAVYTLQMNGQNVDVNVTELTLNGAALGDALTRLEYFPKLSRVVIDGDISDWDAVLELERTYPEIGFVWTVTVLDREVSSDVTELDLSGIPLESVAEVEAALPHLTHLEKLILCDTGLPSEELDGLWKRYPEIRVVWNVMVGKIPVRTDETTLMPLKYGYDGWGKGIKLHNEDITEMKYLVDMVCMDLGHMAITDLEFLRYIPNLKYLIVADCGITDISPMEDLKKLEYLEMFMNNVSDISPLAGCTELRDLNLCRNKITDLSPLLELEHLENIWVSRNPLSKEQQKMIQEAFPEAKAVFDTESSTGRGWRRLPRYYEQRDLLGMFYMVDNTY